MTTYKSSSVFLTKFLLLCTALLVAPLGGCAVFHAEAIEGWVVDAKTDQPIEGVVIVAHWTVDNPINGKEIEQVQIFETVTEMDGRYAFPGWGPKVSTSGGVMRSRSPELLLFKAGYSHAGFSNIESRSKSKFAYNKMKLRIERFTGAPREHADNLSDLNSVLWSMGHTGGAPCGWKSIPRMLRALDAQYADFRRSGLSAGSVVDRLRSNDDWLIKAGCGSIKEFLKP